MNSIIPEKKNILYLDIGNSSIKVAYRQDLQWRQPESAILNGVSDLVEWFRQHEQDFSIVVIASVVKESAEQIRKYLPDEKVRLLSIGDIPRDLLDYKTPDTLGIDRFLTCYGAVAQTNKPVVVIDAGTACTVDYMSGDFVYRGGVIMPGIGILEESLRKHAPGLPAVLRSIPKNWPGKSTKESLRWGLYGVYRDGIRAILERYEEQFDDFDLIITGGASEWMNEVLDRPAKVRSMLIFEGMYFFLEDYL